MTGRPAERVTIDTVAGRAGVSRATVSKALNGRQDIAPGTRDRVIKVAQELGYRPTTARWEPSRRRSLVAVVDVLESPYMVNVLQGILVAATSAQTNLLVSLAPDRDAGVASSTSRDWVADQKDAGVVGIIGVTLAQPDAVMLAAEDYRLPFVMIDPVDTQDTRVVSIGSTNWAGGRSATEHLLRLGHRRIA